MKKNIYKSILVITLTLTTSACEDFLEPEVFSDIAPSNFWQNNDDLESGLIATYDAFQKAIVQRHWDWGEARSDSFRNSRGTSGDEAALIDNALTASVDSADWSGLYKAIAQANLVITNGPQIRGGNEDFIGEAYAIRALSYFYLVRIWGDVPAWTVPISSLNQELSLPRTNANTIMNEIILPDIAKAEELLKNENGKARFTKGGVLSLKAHIYAWNGGTTNWTIASNTVSDLMNLGKYDLENSREGWRNMFLESEGEDGNELIFSIVFDLPTDGKSQTQDKLNDGVSTYLFSQSLGDKWIEKFPVTQVEWDAKYPGFPERNDIGVDGDDENTGLPLYGDWRLKESANFTESRFSNSRTTFKYLKQKNSDDGRNQNATDYPIFRYAGLLLLKAEMEAKLGNTAAAVDLVNEVRRARELPEENEADFTNPDDLLDLVLDERQFELYAEAHRWWDLRRNNKVFDEVRNDGESTTNDENDLLPGEGDPLFSLAQPGKLLWPLGDEVIERNNAISRQDQNPDY